MQEINYNRINYLNIGLMLLSCIVAFFVPFELFLFSYAVLGPLHYLTEIGWLHKKNYYTKGKYDFLALVGLSLLVFYFNFAGKNIPEALVPNIVLYGLLISAVFVLIKDNLYRIVIYVLLLIGLINIHFGDYYPIVVGVYLPTIIHVLIFTWLFMFFGVLKERSKSGYASVIVLGLIVLSFFIFKAPSLQYEVSAYVRKSYDLFFYLNEKLIELFGLSTEGTNDSDIIVFQSNPGFVVMRFIAFSYTYHYLNWFSKTSVIKWHQVSKTSLTITGIVWVLSVAIYFYDYNVGIKALFFLSFLHVFLEFPLNVVSVQGIVKSLAGIKK